MLDEIGQPSMLGGPATIAYLVRFLADPLAAASRLRAEHGPFAILSKPPLRKTPPAFVVASGGAFNRAVLTDPQLWRPVRVMLDTRQESAAKRLGYGLVRMNGAEHAHYRKIVVPPLRKGSVEALGDEMARVAESEVDAWQAGAPADLWAGVRRLMRGLAVRLLFGGDVAAGFPVAEAMQLWLQANWSLPVAGLPVDLPITPYGRWMRQSEKLEAMIRAWAAGKRGSSDPHDLLALIVNSRDPSGQPIGEASVVGHVPTLFGAAYETCQTGLIWTLVLLAQHPQVANALAEEVRGALGGAPPTLARVAPLALLDAVVKESMRVLPPVPMQFRLSTRRTTLGDTPLPSATRLLLSAFLTNRIEALYPEPSRFRPERWATINPSPFDYAVFSAGPRSCPGFAFGQSVVKVALAAILSRFSFRLAAQRVDHRVRVAMTPARPVMATLGKPDQAFAAAPIRGSISRLVTFPA